MSVMGIKKLLLENSLDDKAFEIFSSDSQYKTLIGRTQAVLRQQRFEDILRIINVEVDFIKSAWDYSDVNEYLSHVVKVLDHKLFQYIKALPLLDAFKFLGDSCFEYAIIYWTSISNPETKGLPSTSLAGIAQMDGHSLVLCSVRGRIGHVLYKLKDYFISLHMTIQQIKSLIIQHLEVKMSQEKQNVSSKASKGRSSTEKKATTTKKKK